MSNTKLAKRLTDTLQSTFSPTLFNPWLDCCADCYPCNGPDAKLARLAAHLACEPDFILCGEAPSHRECRHSGIAFTSECQLLDGRIPRISKVNRDSPAGPIPISNALPRSSGMNCISWALRSARFCGTHFKCILINWGTHNQIERQSLPSLNLARPALRMLVDEFPSARVVAVGRKAERLLKSDGHSRNVVRHPAHGGATDFAQELKRLVSG